MAKPQLVPAPNWRDAKAYEEYNLKIRDNIAAETSGERLPWPDHPSSGLDIAALPKDLPTVRKASPAQ
ncbi:protein of unknown function [Thauera humireducens]|uniref:hypothetical protein n=1 Tax=Thauera humireducens TaxID=1134435 RepID=UPI002467A6C9|nr:hypothetical protein [Thauera humireducens]CAH1747853.1 protein of unknown function [Thauera humireducens]